MPKIKEAFMPLTWARLIGQDGTNFYKLKPAARAFLITAEMYLFCSGIANRIDAETLQNICRLGNIDYRTATNLLQNCIKNAMIYQIPNSQVYVIIDFNEKRRSWINYNGDEIDDRERLEKIKIETINSTKSKSKTPIVLKPDSDLTEFDKALRDLEGGCVVKIPAIIYSSCGQETIQALWHCTTAQEAYDELKYLKKRWEALYTKAKVVWLYIEDFEHNLKGEI